MTIDAHELSTLRYAVSVVCADLRTPCPGVDMVPTSWDEIDAHEMRMEMHMNTLVKVVRRVFIPLWIDFCTAPGTPATPDDMRRCELLLSEGRMPICSQSSKWLAHAMDLLGVPILLAEEAMHRILYLDTQETEA